MRKTHAETKVPAAFILTSMRPYEIFVLGRSFGLSAPAARGIQSKTRDTIGKEYKRLTIKQGLRRKK